MFEQIVMRLLLLTPLLALLARADDDSWSWGKQPSQPSDQLSTQAHVIDSILESSRSGKALDGYDQIYEDPEIQQAISSGNDTQARHYIQDRLCGLGLMSVSSTHPVSLT